MWAGNVLILELWKCGIPEGFGLEGALKIISFRGQTLARGASKSCRCQPSRGKTIPNGCAGMEMGRVCMHPCPCRMCDRNGGRRLRQWLIEQIDSELYAGLVWENEEKSMFRIPWKHAGKQDYNQEVDASIFKVGTAW